jgi:hypothetical protein
MKAKLQEAEIEHLSEILTSDLMTLSDLVLGSRSEPITDGKIRLASVILRRWLCEHLIDKLAHSTDLLITFPINCADEIMSFLPSQSEVDFLLLGGVKFDGVPLELFYHSNALPTNSPPLPLETLSEKFLSPGQLLGHRTIYHRGNFFNVGDIINYVANKDGGAHLQIKSLMSKPLDDRLLAMEEANDFLTVGSEKDPSTNLRYGEVHLGLEPNSKDLLHSFDIAVCAIAATFMSLHINGTPYLEFTKRYSVKGFLMDMIADLKSRRKRAVHKRDGEIGLISWKKK